MKPAGVIGIILIIAGAIALIYGGITYTTNKQLFKVGSVEATTKTQKTVPLSPVLGVALVGGGIVLVIVGAKSA